MDFGQVLGQIGLSEITSAHIALWAWLGFWAVGAGALVGMMVGWISARKGGG